MLGRVFPHRDARSGGKVDLPVVLNGPARGRQPRVDGVACDLLRVLVLVAQSTTCQLLRDRACNPLQGIGISGPCQDSSLGTALGLDSNSFATQRVCRNPIWLPRKRSNENSRLRHPTKSPKVNRSGEYRPGENGFRPYRHGRSGEPPRYNPRKQREISPTRTSGERVCGRLAERQGFEPWVGSPPQRFSRPPRSTAPASLR